MTLTDRGDTAHSLQGYKTLRKNVHKGSAEINRTSLPFTVLRKKIPFF